MQLTKSGHHQSGDRPIVSLPNLAYPTRSSPFSWYTGTSINTATSLGYSEQSQVIAHLELPRAQLPVHSTIGNLGMTQLIKSTNSETQTKPTTQILLTYPTGHFLPVPSCESLLPAYTGYIPVICSTGTLPIISSKGHLLIYPSTGSSQLPKQTGIVNSCVHPSIYNSHRGQIRKHTPIKARDWTANEYCKNNSKRGTKRPKCTAKK